MSARLTIEEAERRCPDMVKGQAWKGNHAEYKFLCEVHGEYEQEFNRHARGAGCQKCGRESMAEAQSLTIQEMEHRCSDMIKGQICKGTHAKYWFICGDHGQYKQEFKSHVAGRGCRICGREKCIANRRLTLEKKWHKDDRFKPGKRIPGTDLAYIGPSSRKTSGGNFMAGVRCLPHGNKFEVSFSLLKTGSPTTCRNNEACNLYGFEPGKQIPDTDLIYVGPSDRKNSSGKRMIVVRCVPHGNTFEVTLRGVKSGYGTSCRSNPACVLHGFEPGKVIPGTSLTFMRNMGIQKRNRHQWGQRSIIVRCEHGNEFEIPLVQVKSGTTTSCMKNPACVVRGFELGKLIPDTNFIYQGYETGRDGKPGRALVACLCGKELRIPLGNLRNGGSTSCGCIKTSKLVRAVKEFLTASNISFVCEKRFDECRGQEGHHGRVRLPFDFYLTQLETLIECQGMQHYRPIRWSKNTSIKQAEQNFQDLLHRDRIKKAWAGRNGYTLIVVPYTIKNIASFLEDMLPKRQKRERAGV